MWPRDIRGRVEILLKGQTEKLCLVCGGTATFLSYALLAPWIEELFGLRRKERPIQTKLFKCYACDFAFYSYRYSEDQIDKLYFEYRGTNYFKVRASWETYYTAEINCAFSVGSPELTERLDFMWGAINGAVDTKSIRTIVDFGGDQGQFLPTHSYSRKYVIDLSSHPLVDGVTRLPDLRSATLETPMIVILSGVLEHVSFPRAFLSSVKDDVPPGTFVYLEVPLDYCEPSPIGRSYLYRGYLCGVRALPPLFRAVDEFTGRKRKMFGKVPLFGLQKQSEHLNFFSKLSLTELLKVEDFEVIAVTEQAGFSTGVRNAKKIGVVARKK